MNATDMLINLFDRLPTEEDITSVQYNGQGHYSVVIQLKGREHRSIVFSAWVMSGHELADPKASILSQLELLLRDSISGIRVRHPGEGVYPGKSEEPQDESGKRKRIIELPSI